MITLTTKFHGPTNTKPSRLSCRAPGRPWRVFVSYDHGSTDVAKHARALAIFCAKFFHIPGEGHRWRAYHYGHTDDGMSFIPLREGDAVTDCVWVHTDGRYSLTRPEYDGTPMFGDGD